MEEHSGGTPLERSEPGADGTGGADVTGRTDVAGGSPGAPEPAAPDPASPEPASPEPDPPQGAGRAADRESAVPATADGRAWSTPALAALSLSAVLLLGAAAWHLFAVFLHVAPSNAVSQRYRQQVDSWVYPEFEQNWKLFAPNPLQQNVTVDARVKTLGPDGTHHVQPWVGLTAQDIAAIRHNPAPGHIEQNLLRRAWDVYSGSHDDQGHSTDGQRGDLLQQYLKRITLQRLGREWNGERIIEVQLRSGTADVAPPPWSTESWSDGTAYREQPWWLVTDQDYAGL